MTAYYIVAHIVLMAIYIQLDVLHLSIYVPIYAVAAFLAFFALRLSANSTKVLNKKLVFYFVISLIHTMLLFSALRVAESYYISFAAEEGSISSIFWQNIGLSLKQRFYLGIPYLIASLVISAFCLEYSKKFTNMLFPSGKPLLKKNSVIHGALLGFILWVIDYDFFIHVGGPETPLSDFICKSVGLRYCLSASEFFVPPLILMLIGGGIGILFLIVKNVYIKTK